MLCLHRDNNPAYGDFYEFTQLDGGEGPISDDSTVGVDDQFSFHGVFKEQKQTPPLVPGSTVDVSGRVLRAREDGVCVNLSTVEFLIPVEESCIDSGNITKGENYTVELSVGEFNGTFTASGTKRGNYSVWNISIRWDSNPDGQQASLRRRGYEFGDAVETGDGRLLPLLLPTEKGVCDENATGFVAFGSDIDVTCFNQTWDFRANQTVENPWGWEIGSLREVPGIGAGPVRIDGVVSVPPENMTFLYGLDGVIQELLVFYRLAGDRQNPQKVIDKAERRYYTVPRVTLMRPEDSMVKMRTIVTFVEIPSDVTLDPDSRTSSAEQAWLPF
jgi:hypothetical protein